MLSSHRDILKEVDASHRQEISPEWVTGGHAEGTPVVRARNRHRYYLATPFARERESEDMCVLEVCNGDKFTALLAIGLD